MNLLVFSCYLSSTKLAVLSNSRLTSAYNMEMRSSKENYRANTRYNRYGMYHVSIAKISTRNYPVRTRTKLSCRLDGYLIA